MDADKNYEIELLRERVSDLESALGQKNKLLENTFKLTKALSNVLGVLLALPAVQAELIQNRVGVSDAKVAIHRLRKLLAPWDIKIKSQRTVGYWITDEDKQKINDILVAAREGAGRQFAA